MPNIISTSFNDVPVYFDSKSFLNATTIAKSYGKLAADYLRLSSTKAYIKALEKAFMGNPIDVTNQLVIVKKGSSAYGGGTWLHPKLAIDFARWLNPDFAVWCDGQIEQLIHGRSTGKLPAQSPGNSSEDRLASIYVFCKAGQQRWHELNKLVQDYDRMPKEQAGARLKKLSGDLFDLCREPVMLSLAYRKVDSDERVNEILKIQDGQRAPVPD